MTGTVAIVVFVVAMIASIMVHEWGHFATARRFGMRADRFFLGFGPTLWSTRVGETEYGVKLLPLGGFVRILGMGGHETRLPGVPAALRDAIADGADPAESLGQLLDERGTPQRTRQAIVGRLERTLAAEERATVGAPGGLDLPPDHGRGHGLDHGHDDGHSHDHGHGANRAHGGDADADAGDRDGDGTTDAAATGRDPDLAAPTAPSTVDPVLLANEMIASEVVPTGRVGDLHHRLVRGDEGRFFGDRPAWQRVVVLASGSALHLAQAAVLLFLGLLLIGPPAIAPVVSSFAEAELPDGTVVPSAAQAAGLEVGDRIVSIDDVATNDFDEIRATIEQNAGRSVDVVVQRPGTEEPVDLQVTPAAVEGDDGETIGLFGFVPTIENRPMAADRALYETFVGDMSLPALTWGTVQSLGEVFGPEGVSSLVRQLAGEEERDGSGGISLVGAADVAGRGTQQSGPLFLFTLLAAVNVFLGVFNILPLPPLDGGHIAVLAVEHGVNAVRRARGQPADYSVDPRTIAGIVVPVLVFLMTIGLALAYLDIVDPVSLQ